MRVLLVTGRLAVPVVLEAAKRCPSKYTVDVRVLPVDVAALATPRLILRHLKKWVKAGRYDVVMVPGAVQGSLRDVGDALGIKIVKGPMHAVDIPAVLDLCDPSSLSPDDPADVVLGDYVGEQAKRILSDVEASLKSREHILVGDLLVPVSPPPLRVISEVSEVHSLEDAELLRVVGRRIEEGADIISLGFEAGVSRPGDVRKAVRLVKERFDVPVALDSIIPAEIEAGVEAGADMVMSLEAGNIGKVAEKLDGVPAVVIPYDSGRGLYPRSAPEKVEMLNKLVDEALRRGVRHVVADPVLDPVSPRGPGGALESLAAYRRFKRLRPEIPMLLGAGNVAELMDADTIGVNALLVMLGAEAGASMVLVVEKSAKASGSTREAALASQMATIAWAKESPPKDLGIDLLVVKEKRRVQVPLDAADAEIVDASEALEHPLDPLGYFRVRVNHDEGVIEALYRGAKGKILIRGRDARLIRDEVLRRGLVSSLSHAFYLGIELGKAEAALEMGKNYVQEEKLFVEKKLLDVPKARRWEDEGRG